MKNNIPEGATHKHKNYKHYYKMGINDVWYVFNKPSWSSATSANAMDWRDRNLILIKEEKQMDSIYTQEMHDAGELPRVGMRCNVFSLEQQKEVEAVILSIFDSKRGKGCVCESDLVGIHVYEYSQVLPIKEKTDREKAIDDVAHTLKANGHEDSVLAICIINSLVDIEALTFAENKND